VFGAGGESSLHSKVEVSSHLVQHDISELRSWNSAFGYWEAIGMQANGVGGNSLSDFDFSTLGSRQWVSCRSFV
jgi:hypothetical protein